MRIMHFSCVTENEYNAIISAYNACIILSCSRRFIFAHICPALLIMHAFYSRVTAALRNLDNES